MSKSNQGQQNIYLNINAIDDFSGNTANITTLTCNTITTQNLISTVNYVTNETVYNDLNVNNNVIIDGSLDCDVIDASGNLSLMIDGAEELNINSTTVDFKSNDVVGIQDCSINGILFVNTIAVDEAVVVNELFFNNYIQSDNGYISLTNGYVNAANATMTTNLTSPAATITTLNSTNAIISTNLTSPAATVTTMNSTNIIASNNVTANKLISYHLDIDNNGLFYKQSNGGVGIGTANPISALSVCTNLHTISPTVAGIHMGIQSIINCALELCSDPTGWSYIDFTVPGVDAKGSFTYNPILNTMTFYTASEIQMIMSNNLIDCTDCHVTTTGNMTCATLGSTTCNATTTNFTTCNATNSYVTNNAFITNNLTITNGNMTLETGSIILDEANVVLTLGDVIAADGQMVCQESIATVSVYSYGTIQSVGNATFGGNLDVTGTSLFKNTITQTGGGLVSLTGNLNVNDRLYFNKTLGRLGFDTTSPDSAFHLALSSNINTAFLTPGIRMGQNSSNMNLSISSSSANSSIISFGNSSSELEVATIEHDNITNTMSINSSGALDVSATAFNVNTSLTTTGGFTISGSIPGTRTSNGIYMGKTGSSYSAIELVNSNGAYIDFTDSSTDYYARIVCTNSLAELKIATTAGDQLKISNSTIDCTDNLITTTGNISGNLNSTRGQILSFIGEANNYTAWATGDYMYCYGNGQKDFDIFGIGMVGNSKLKRWVYQCISGAGTALSTSTKYIYEVMLHNTVICYCIVDFSLSTSSLSNRKATGKYSSSSSSQIDVEYAITDPGYGYNISYRVLSEASKSSDSDHRMTTFFQTTEDW